MRDTAAEQCRPESSERNEAQVPPLRPDQVNVGITALSWKSERPWIVSVLCSCELPSVSVLAPERQACDDVTSDEVARELPVAPALPIGRELASKSDIGGQAKDAVADTHETRHTY